MYGPGFARHARVVLDANPLLGNEQDFAHRGHLLVFGQLDPPIELLGGLRQDFDDQDRIDERVFLVMKLCSGDAPAMAKISPP